MRLGSSPLHGGRHQPGWPRALDRQRSPFALAGRRSWRARSRSAAAWRTSSWRRAFRWGPQHRQGRMQPQRCTRPIPAAPHACLRKLQYRLGPIRAALVPPPTRTAAAARLIDPPPPFAGAGGAAARPEGPPAAAAGGPTGRAGWRRDSRRGQDGARPGTRRRRGWGLRAPPPLARSLQPGDAMPAAGRTQVECTARHNSHARWHDGRPCPTPAHSLRRSPQLQLKAWFPSADLGQLLGRRPSLLTAEEFSRIPGARRQLLARCERREAGSNHNRAQRSLLVTGAGWVGQGASCDRARGGGRQPLNACALRRSAQDRPATACTELAGSPSPQKPAAAAEAATAAKGVAVAQASAKPAAAAETTVAASAETAAAAAAVAVRP
jgi:hypothetical protein